MEIVEESYYDHNKYGRVRVVAVSDETVSMQCVGETNFIAGQKIPKGKKEEVSAFLECSEPANITIDAEPAEFDLTGVNQ